MVCAAAGLSIASAVVLGSAKGRDRSKVSAACGFIPPKPRWTNVYGGQGAPKAPSFLADKEGDVDEDTFVGEGKFAVPAWLTESKWKTLRANDRCRSLRYLLQYWDENGNRAVEKGRDYAVDEALDVLFKMQERAPCTFDPSIELAMAMNLDAKFPDQQVRCSMKIPHGSGKNLKVGVFCNNDEEEEVLKFGAYKAGETLAKAIEEEDIDFDILITKPSMMPRLAKLGKILGPRRLMPSPKSGTVIQDYESAIQDFSLGRLVELRADRASHIYCTVGRLSMGKNKIAENVQAVLQSLADNKPSGAKKKYWNGVHLVASRSPAVPISQSEFPKLVFDD